MEERLTSEAEDLDAPVAEGAKLVEGWATRCAAGARTQSDWPGKTASETSRLRVLSSCLLMSNLMAMEKRLSARSTVYVTVGRAVQ